jgi:hypothetical protein
LRRLEDEKEETTDYTDYTDFFVFSSCLCVLVAIFLGDITLIHKKRIK